MLLFTRRLELKGEQLQRIKEYCLSGKPIVAVRTASHGIQSWLAFDHEVLGGNYQGHYGSDLPTKVRIAANAREHPILKGVNPFVSHASLYKNHGHARDLNILLTGNNTIETEPIAWTRKYKNGRLFYTSLGHPDDFEQESFRRLVANGLFWTSGREVPVPRNR